MRDAGMLVVVAGALLVAWVPAVGQTCTSDSFTYPNGALNGVGGWTGGQSGRVEVLNNEVKVTAGSPAVTAVLPVTCNACSEYTITIQAKAGAGTSTLWSVRFNGPGGANLARWYGTGTSATGRDGDTGSITSAYTLTGAYSELKVVINTQTHQTQYFAAGTSLGTLANGGAASLDNIQIISQYPAAAGDNMFLDDLVVVHCTCHTIVDQIDGMYSTAPVGGTAMPSFHNITITNDGATSPVTYTAIESDPDGNPHTSGWLTLTQAGDGSLNANESEQITATIDATGLARGVYSSCIKFTDSCSPQNINIRFVQLVVGDAPCFVDDFPYHSGFLHGNGLWNGGYTGDIEVAEDPDATWNNVVKINAHGGAQTTFSTWTWPTGEECPECDNHTITCRVKVKASPTGGGGQAWFLDFNDATSAHQNLVRWEGTYNSVRGRPGGFAAPYITDSVTIPNDRWMMLEAVIETLNNTASYYYYDDLGQRTLLGNGTLSNGNETGIMDAGDSVGQIQFTRVNNSVAGYTLFDDLEVLRCEGECTGSLVPHYDYNDYTLLAWAPDVDGTGGQTNPANYTYILYNSGLVPISFTMEEALANGDPFDYEWMTLTKDSGTAPVDTGSNNPWDTAVVAFPPATGTTAVGPGMHLGYLKLTDQCDPSVAPFMRSVKLNVGNCLTENFDDYAAGPLVQCPGWEAGATPLGWPPPPPSGINTPITVADDSGNKVLKLDGKTDTGAADAVDVNYRRIDYCPRTCPTDGLIRVTMRVRGSRDSTSQFWTIGFYRRNSDTLLAGWQGNASQLWAQAGDQEGTHLDLVDGWNEVEARINLHDYDVDSPGGKVPANSTRFFLNGNYKDPGGVAQDAYHGATDGSVAGLGLSWVKNPDENQAALQTIEIDDLALSTCESMSICNTPFADADGDGDVDQADFAVFQQCYTGQGVTPIPSDPAYCACFNRDDTGDLAPDIDSYDLTAFEACASGPGVPANPNCGG